MTTEQLERAARHYCKLMGQDPEETVMTSPPPNPNGTVNAVAIYVPRWKLVAQNLHSGWAMNEALKEGMRDPRVGDMLGKLFPTDDRDGARRKWEGGRGWVDKAVGTA